MKKAKLSLPKLSKVEFAKFFCSGFYTGEFPFAPGTAGSFAYLLIWYFVLSPNYLWQLIALVLVTTIGWILTAYLLPRINQDGNKKHNDPSWIVIDEWAGLAIAFLAVDPKNVWQIIAAFALFRFFDATKIWPVSYAEKKAGAAGVMLDDIVAGVLSVIILACAQFLI